MVNSMLKKLCMAALLLCSLANVQAQSGEAVGNQTNVQAENQAGPMALENNPYHAVVAQDGSGQYQSVQAAIDAAPANRIEPWLIFVKNGNYEEQVVVPKEKTHIHLIGQDKEKTAIRLWLNVGGKPQKPEDDKSGYWSHSVHNPESPVYKKEGTVVMVKGDGFFADNISFINDFGRERQAGPQALAMSTQCDKAAFDNCRFISFQDTWMTSSRNDAYRLYVNDCYLEGAVDYFYAGGDAFVENTVFYNVREGSVIVAPSHKTAKWGYVMKNCIVDGNEKAANVKKWGVKLGRPWHNAPKCVWINTTMNIPISPEGWTDMGTIPEIFAEYNSVDKEGNPLDLSRRKNTYTERASGRQGTCPTTISKEDAEKYTYENVVMQDDQWNPRAMMAKLPAPAKAKMEGNALTWKRVRDAAGYIVFSGEKVLGFTKETYFVLPQGHLSDLGVQAVNEYGVPGGKFVL